MIREQGSPGLPGLFVLLTVLGAWGLAGYRLFTVDPGLREDAMIMIVAMFVVGVFVLNGLFVVQPNQAKVLQLFGRYAGTARVSGLRWSNPFYSKRAISLRVRNFESARSKVNDSDGNPIEIAAVVVWRVVDSAEACFEVDNYEHFVQVQSEAALRNLVSSYPYDGHDDVDSLRGSASKIAEHLKAEIQARLTKAGVQIVEARFSHLAYAPEIASAMLQRQQAGAIVAARRQIVEGAVGIVEAALARLAEKNVVHLDPERKAQMVTNLLVVLCGERSAQPVINAGSIHQ